MLLEKKLKDATASKVSKSPTLWEVVLDLVWELFWSQKLEKNTLIESWKLSQLYPHQKSLIPSLNHITQLYQSINWLKTPMNAWSLITKLFMIFASEHLNWQPQPMVILTIWSQLLCLVLHAASDSQVNWTLTWENSQSTWYHSPVSTSSWLDLHHLPQEDHNNTEHSLYQNLPNKCSMLKTWCALLTQDTVDIWLPLLFLEEECRPKKLMNKCWTSKTRTLHISLNGFPTISNLQFAIFHQKV